MDKPKIGIYYFSGTGNTKYVVEQLANALGNLSSDVTVTSIEKLDRASLAEQTAIYDIIGFAYPIYGFGAPEIVSDLVDRLEQIAPKPTFIIRSAADDVALNRAGAAKISKALSQKGYAVYYEKIVVMPSNWLTRYDYDKSKARCEAVPQLAADIARDILSLENDRPANKPITAWLANTVKFMESKIGIKMFAWSLRATDECTMCGKCVRTCPRQNIREEGKIVFGYKCMMCMRCIYTCPAQAITSRGMKFCILKPPYDLDDYLKREKEGSA